MVACTTETGIRRGTTTCTNLNKEQVLEGSVNGGDGHCTVVHSVQQVAVEVRATVNVLSVPASQEHHRHVGSRVTKGWRATTQITTTTTMTGNNKQQQAAISSNKQQQLAHRRRPPPPPDGQMHTMPAFSTTEHVSSDVLV